MRKYYSVFLCLVGWFLLNACVSQRVVLPEFTTLPDGASIYFSIDMQAEEPTARLLITTFLPDIAPEGVQDIISRIRRADIALYPEGFFIWLDASIPYFALSAAFSGGNWDRLSRNFWNNRERGLNVQWQEKDVLLLYSEKLLGYKLASPDIQQFLGLYPISIRIHDIQSYLSISYVEEVETMQLYLTEARTLRLELHMASDVVAKLALVFSRLLARTGGSFFIEGMGESIDRTDNILHAESKPLHSEELAEIVQRLLQGTLVVTDENN